MPIFNATSLIFPYAITPFDICKKYPEVWHLIKKLYWICFFISYCIVYNYLYTNIQKYFSSQKNKVVIQNANTNNCLKLLVGTDFSGQNFYIPERGLYQNILITGTIGSRKNFISNVSIYGTIN